MAEVKIFKQYEIPVINPEDSPFIKSGDGYYAKNSIQSMNYSPNSSTGWKLGENGESSSIPASYLYGSINLDNLNIASQGWTSTLTFSSTDYNTVAWTSGTITTASGTSYSISAGNTGNMSNPTYIYLDVAASTTALQITTTASSSVGAGKILICVANNVSDTNKDAEFQAFGGKGGISKLITADVVAAGTITANEIAANTITTSKLSATAIDGMTINGATINAKSGSTTLASLDSSGLKIYGQFATWYSSGGTAVGQIYADSTTNLQIYTYNGKTLELGGASGASLNAGANNCELRTGNSAHIRCSDSNYSGFVGTSSKVFSNMYATTYYMARSGVTTKYIQLGSGGSVETNGDFYASGQLSSGSTSINIGGYVFNVYSDPDASGKYYLRTA